MSEFTGHTLGSSFSTCMKKYATFQGRATRSEYWFFQLVVMICACIPLVNIIAMLAFLIPGISVFVRRMHDIGKSGWFYWLALIPFVGGIILLVLCCQDSQRGTNQYGPSEKYPA